MAMTTHMSYDGYSNPELLAEIRYHYKGPFHFGAPDMVVVNLTKDKVWVRDGVVPDYPSIAAPKFDIAAMGGMIIPGATQQASGLPGAVDSRRRDSAGGVLPQGLQPELIPFWPTDKAIFIPAAQVPPGLWLKGKPAAAAQPAPAKSPE